jgi:2-polyprenyl-6-methoxyphenol hydroxylase-like FAD-dependent oxidoreductase
VVTASTYHDEQGGQAVLLGDAAHSTGGSLGQGANSALMDVVALRDALRGCGGDVAAATAAYSAAAVPQGEALVKVCAQLSVGRCQEL